MVTPRRVDLETWPRRSWFDHYFRQSPCTYSVTAELEVSDLEHHVKLSGARSYPAHVWAVSAVINRHDEFRMTVTDSGEPAVWPRIHPAFTTFHAPTETFSSLWAPYVDDFGVFQDSMINAIEQHRGALELFPQNDVPENIFDISAVPWTSFTGFTLNIESGYTHLAPIITIGRRMRREGRSYLPIAVQLHHAVADGFHAARLINEIQDLCDRPKWLVPATGLP